jgi:hypothetical protein
MGVTEDLLQAYRRTAEATEAQTAILAQQAERLEAETRTKLANHKAAARLAGLTRNRTPGAWQERAADVVASRRAESVEGYLQERIAAVVEGEALSIRIQAFRSDHGLPDEVTGPARERIKREGGISHQHAQDLGYESVADFQKRRP